MTTMSIDNQRESLALTVACGRSVKSWAKRHDVAIRRAFEWYMQSEFHKLVETARMRVVDRMVGRLLGGASRAITELVRLCTRSASDAIRLSASRALLAHWVKVSEHFELASRMTAVEEHYERRQPTSGPWRPRSPYEALHQNR